MGDGMNTIRLFRTLIVATVLAAVASACVLSALYDGTQARVTGRGSYCLRTGPHPSQLAMVSEDGGETWTR